MQTNPQEFQEMDQKASESGITPVGAPAGVKLDSALARHLKTQKFLEAAQELQETAQEWLCEAAEELVYCQRISRKLRSTRWARGNGRGKEYEDLASTHESHTCLRCRSERCRSLRTSTRSKGNEERQTEVAPSQKSRQLMELEAEKKAKMEFEATKNVRFSSAEWTPLSQALRKKRTKPWTRIHSTKSRSNMRSEADSGRSGRARKYCETQPYEGRCKKGSRCTEGHAGHSVLASSDATVSRTASWGSNATGGHHAEIP